MPKKNELGLNKDFSDAILRNIDAYIVLANRNFLVEKTNYYSLNSEKDDCVLHRVGELASVQKCVGFRCMRHSREL